MAKYEVKMSCGHTETIQLFGKMADRDKKIAWLEEHGECSACYKARIAAAHAAETAAAAAKAAEEKLPVLTGSEKQIAWALSIRAKKFEALNEMFANANANATDEQRRQNKIAFQATKNVLASKTESRFWIDNRNVESRKFITANNLQDELKEELARLTAEAERNEVLSTPTVTTDAQETAANAEIELATATDTTNEHEQEASTMTITTTTNKVGKISGYYVDGVKTRKADIDYIINSRRDDIIVVDYHVGTEFKALTRSPYRLKVVFTGMDRKIMTQAAADELGYKVIKVFTGSYNGTACIVEKETVVDEYAVSTEAQKVAVDAEIELATATDTTDEINIDDATYRTILLHAEKISNGQNSFAAVLKNELRNLLNVDASELIEAIKTDSNFLNRVRCYLADFPIIITNDEGTRYHLVKTDDYCELDIINDEPATEEEKSTMTTTERFWTKSYNRYGASRITAFATLDEAIASAKAEVAEDHDHWVDIIRETNTIPKVIETIEWKPELDELNDVSEPITVEEKFVNAYGKTFSFINIGGERVSFVDGEVHIIGSDKYEAHFNRRTGKYVVAIVNEGGNYKAKTLDTDEEFFAEMAKRGACEPEPPVDTDKPVDDYDSKRQERIARNQLLRKWNAELADLKAGLSKMSGKHQKRGVLGTYKLEFGLYVTTTNDECKYLLKVAGLPIGIYDTPAQVDKVIDMLREAIERGDKEFKFPTVDELNQPPMDTDLERKIKIEDSLRRAMEIATAEHERFLRLAATSYNKGTRKDCFREADNELKLYNICWQATNELWTERW